MLSWRRRRIAEQIAAQLRPLSDETWKVFDGDAETLWAQPSVIGFFGHQIGLIMESKTFISIRDQVEIEKLVWSEIAEVEPSELFTRNFFFPKKEDSHDQYWQGAKLGKAYQAALHEGAKIRRRAIFDRFLSTLV